MIQSYTFVLVKNTSYYCRKYQIGEVQYFPADLNSHRHLNFCPFLSHTICILIIFSFPCCPCVHWLSSLYLILRACLSCQVLLDSAFIKLCWRRNRESHKEQWFLSFPVSPPTSHTHVGAGSWICDSNHLWIWVK